MIEEAYRFATNPSPEAYIVCGLIGILLVFILESAVKDKE